MCGALSADELVGAVRAYTSGQSRCRRGTVGREDTGRILRHSHSRCREADEDAGRRPPSKSLACNSLPIFLGRLNAEENAVSAEAASDVNLCRVPKAALERMVKTNPALAERLMAQTLRELDEAREWMVTLGRQDGGRKVASFLLLIATHLDPEAAGDSRQFRPAFVARRHCRLSGTDDRDGVAPAVQARSPMGLSGLSPTGISRCRSFRSSRPSADPDRCAGRPLECMLPRRPNLVQECWSTLASTSEVRPRTAHTNQLVSRLSPRRSPPFSRGLANTVETEGPLVDLLRPCPAIPAS